MDVAVVSAAGVGVGGVALALALVVWVVVLYQIGVVHHGLNSIDAVDAVDAAVGVIYAGRVWTIIYFLPRDNEHDVEDLSSMHHYTVMIVGIVVWWHCWKTRQ